MMRWLRVSGLALGWAIAVTGAQAQTVKPRLVYDCHLTLRQGLLPARIFLMEMQAPGQVDVWDGLVKATVGAPMSVEVEEDSPQRLRLKWVVRGLKGTSSRGAAAEFDVAYKAVYVRGGPLTMTAEVLGGYENPLAQGSGGCTPQ